MRVYSLDQVQKSALMEHVRLESSKECLHFGLTECMVLLDTLATQKILLVKMEQDIYGPATTSID